MEFELNDIGFEPNLKPNKNEINRSFFASLFLFFALS